MKTMKKSILSLLLICAILVGSVAVSTVSTSAASSPQLNLLRGGDNKSFNVVWNIVPNAIKYRIYFGTYNNSNNGWRRFTVVNANSCSKYSSKSLQFLINSNSLKGQKWYNYGDDKGISTPSLKTTECYKCQVEALGDGDRHIVWTNVGYVYFGKVDQPSFDYSGNFFKFTWKKADGANGYEFAGKCNNNPYEIDYISGNSITKALYTGNAYNFDRYLCKVRACVKVNGKIVAYGPWSATSSVTIVP